MKLYRFVSKLSPCPDGKFKNTFLFFGIQLARIVEASGELIEKGEDAFPFGGIPDWPNDDMFLMWGVAQSRARQLENITVALVTTEVTKEIDRMLPPWDQWVGYISGLNSTDISQVRWCTNSKIIQTQLSVLQIFYFTLLRYHWNI